NSHNAECPVPALFQALELSSAGVDNLSNIFISFSGASSFNKVPSVALMIPPPINMTSVLLCCVLITNTVPLLYMFIDTLSLSKKIYNCDKAFSIAKILKSNPLLLCLKRKQQQNLSVRF